MQPPRNSDYAIEASGLATQLQRVHATPDGARNPIGRAPRLARTSN